MADLNACASVGEVSVTSTAKTFIAITAPTNQRIRIKGLEIFGKGVSNTDTPIKIELVYTSALSAGTAGTAPVYKPLDPDYAETLQCTVTGNYTAEPTYGGTTYVERVLECHPQTGMIIYFPMHDEPKLKGGSAMGFRLTSNQTETVALNVIVEE